MGRPKLIPDNEMDLQFPVEMGKALEPGEYIYIRYS